MSASAFTCPKCGVALAIEPGTTELVSSCPQCAAALEAYFFPANFRPQPVELADTLLGDDTEASCFYHPHKQARQVCDGCGRLICALCSIDLGAEQRCPQCLASGKKKGKLAAFDNSRTCYDRLAISLAVLSLVVYVFSVFLAPAAIYVSIRHWNSPGSLLGTSKLRFVVAILLSFFILLAWFAIISLIIMSPHHHRR